MDFLNLGNTPDQGNENTSPGATNTFDDNNLDLNSSYLNMNINQQQPQLSSSYTDNSKNGLSKSYNAPLKTALSNEDEPSNIRASLSRALNHNTNTGINYPIPEEDEDGGDNYDDDDGEPGTRLQSSVTTPKTTAALGTSARSRRDTLTSPNVGPGGQPIDRKRRDNMNEKIYELMKMMPAKLFEEGKDKSSGTKDGKPNKGQILSKAVEYINMLQAQIDEKNRKEVELSIKLRNLEISSNIPISERMNLLHTSAEIGLAKIGVGPLAEEQPEQSVSPSQPQRQQQQQSQQRQQPQQLQTAQLATLQQQRNNSSSSDFSSPNIKP